MIFLLQLLIVGMSSVARGRLVTEFLPSFTVWPCWPSELSKRKPIKSNDLGNSMAIMCRSVWWCECRLLAFDYRVFYRVFFFFLRSDAGRADRLSRSHGLAWHLTAIVLPDWSVWRPSFSTRFPPSVFPSCPLDGRGDQSTSENTPSPPPPPVRLPAVTQEWRVHGQSMASMIHQRSRRRDAADSSTPSRLPLKKKKKKLFHSTSESEHSLRNCKPIFDPSVEVAQFNKKKGKKPGTSRFLIKERARL